MGKYIIGISLGNNTSACVVCPSGVKFAISEERLINEKNTKNFPINATKECIDYVRFNGQEDFQIYISSYEVINKRLLKYMGNVKDSSGTKDIYGIIKSYISESCGVLYSKISLTRVEHHEAHRLPALYMSGFLNKPHKTIAITYDGFGDGLCATVMDCQNMEMLSRKRIGNSLGLVYQFVTGALGYKEHQHEGKLTGLAGFGEPTEINAFKDILAFNNLTGEFRNSVNTNEHHDVDIDAFNYNIEGFGDFLRLKKAVYGLVENLLNKGTSKEDIASSLQNYVEQEFVDWIKEVLLLNYRKPSLTGFNLVLSGGVFANVKLNNRILKAFKPTNMFVLPAMGDEGTCIGAAIKGCIEINGKQNMDIIAWGKDDLYLGKTRILDEDYVVDICDREKLFLEVKNPISDKNTIYTLTNALRENKIICLSMGASEFGPRALGHNSILYDATKFETNSWLNDRLNRTEFMPFAPIVLDVFADDLFYNVDSVRKSLKYMTVALDCKQEFIDNYKAACHIDNTARPQVLSRVDNTFLYDLMINYFNKTGKKALINTSFNLHNFPIVFDEKIAIDSFVKADLDILVLDKYLIKK